MALVCSSWQIRFDGTAYLSQGDQMDGELRVESSQVVQNTPLIRSAVPHLAGRQNITTVYQWSRVVEYDSPEEARLEQFSAAVNFPTEKKTAIVDVYDTGASPTIQSTCTYTDGAVMESIVPTIRDSLRVTYDYTMICGTGVIS